MLLLRKLALTANSVGNFKSGPIIFPVNYLINGVQIKNVGVRLVIPDQYRQAPAGSYAIEYCRLKYGNDSAYGSDLGQQVSNASFIPDPNFPLGAEIYSAGGITGFTNMGGRNLWLSASATGSFDANGNRVTLPWDAEILLFDDDDTLELG